MPRYVPPALRKKAGDASVDGSQQSNEPQSSESSATAVARSLADLELTSESTKPASKALTNRYTLEEVHSHYRLGRSQEDPLSFALCPRSTLNNSIHLPDDLAYIMLFPGANPNWKTKSTIFAKSNLELLPGLDGAIGRGWTDGGGKRAVEHGRGAHWRADSTQEPATAQQTDGDAEQPEQSPSVEQPDNGPTNIQDDPSASSVKSALSQQSHLPKPRSEAKPLVDYISDDEEEEDTDTTIADSANFTNTPDAPKPRAIPVFEQKSRGHRTVEFVGFYRMQKVSFLRPRSKALVHMLEVKFGGKLNTGSNDGPPAGGQAQGEIPGDGDDKTDQPDENSEPVRPDDKSVAAPAKPTKPSFARNRNNKRNMELTGPASRSGEQWSKSLSVPWAVMKMQAIPLPQKNEDEEKQEAFWGGNDDEGLKAPVIETFPEKDGDHYKESKDRFKERRGWREQRSKLWDRTGGGGGGQDGGSVDSGTGGKNVQDEGGSVDWGLGEKSGRDDDGSVNGGPGEKGEKGNGVAAAGGIREKVAPNEGAAKSPESGGNEDGDGMEVESEDRVDFTGHRG